jgi:hypothetical protein
MRTAALPELGADLSPAIVRPSMFGMLMSLTTSLMAGVERSCAAAVAPVVGRAHVEAVLLQEAQTISAHRLGVVDDQIWASVSFLFRRIPARRCCAVDAGLRTREGLSDRNSS